MNHTFDKQYWDDIWSGERGTAMSSSAPNPHLIHEVEGIRPGSALDAGCGAGAEAIWLARVGWDVTAADVTAAALTVGERRAADAGLAGQIRWMQADLSSWEPDQQFDLVTTCYAHPAIPQLEFYRRLATWVAPGGTLLVVGHLHRDTGSHHHGHGHENQPPAEASATATAITELLDPNSWVIATAEEPQRTMTVPGGQTTTLHDVVVRATHR